MLDTSKMTDISKLKTSGLENAEELTSLATEAINFIESHSWCKRIVNVFFDRGWGSIIGVFYITIEPISEDVPSNLWVIVGDIPPAYIDAGDNPNGACAIDAYVFEMQEWINHVMQGQSVAELIPVNVPPEEKYAEMLQKRLDVIKIEILSKFTDELILVKTQ